ncbi:suppressor of SWI4 1 homolog [Tachysurus fulvidraco]|uniref:suppressor of SWI4 1 homolog n=1 Tax=Tachysurus fulvidraco TaxID=1234273 RepID=UPI001FED77CB|nr:suppressor of SWI4 1 homolog [Tachysurus fulvidraco]
MHITPLSVNRTKNQTKARVAANHVAEETYASVPHSFIFHRGLIGKNVEELMMDMRHVMEPKKNVLKDFVTAAGPLGVTHFLVFTKTENSVNLRLARLPKGPTVHFQVTKHVDGAHDESFTRDLSLKVVPVGMSKGVKKLLQEKFPNMNKLEDISELLLKGVNLSESEAEQDGEHNITELPQVYSCRGNMRAQQSAVRLTEIGPRMTLKLVKIVKGMGEGNVLYHSVVTKSEAEIREILKRKEARLKEKAERRRKQEQNVALKRDKRDENKKRSLDGMKRKWQQEGAASDDSEVEDPGMQDDQPEAEESEDEAEYYRQAVGEEPDEDMFPTAKRKHAPGRSQMPFKKRKLSRAPGEEKAHRPKPTGKASFGDKNFAARKFGWKNTGKNASGSRGFKAGKMSGASNRFGKSKGGKDFGGKQGERFGEKKSGPKGLKGKGQRAKTGSAFKAGPRGRQGKKDFMKKKKERR